MNETDIIKVSADHINKLQTDNAALRRQVAELRQLATDLLSVAEQLPALQPGGWEFEVIEEARAALGRVDKEA